MDFWNEGDRVFAYWDDDEYYYPATILSIEGEDIYIRFDTGEEEWTTADDLDDYAAEVDEELECQAASGNLYYDVTVIGVDGEKVEVEYEDGTTEWTTLERLRFFID